MVQYIASGALVYKFCKIDMSLQILADDAQSSSLIAKTRYIRILTRIIPEIQQRECSTRKLGSHICIGSVQFFS